MLVGDDVTNDLELTGQLRVNFLDEGMEMSPARQVMAVTHVVQKLGKGLEGNGFGIACAIICLNLEKSGEVKNGLTRDVPRRRLVCLKQRKLLLE